MRNWLSRYKFQTLLVALMSLLVIYPLLSGPEGSPVLARCLLTVMFLAGGWIAYAKRHTRLLALLLLTAVVAGTWAGTAFDGVNDSFSTVFFHSSAMLFQVFVLTVVLPSVFRERTVSIEMVAAALCGYLLIGITFGHAFCVIESASPGSFHGFDPGKSRAQNHFQLTFFSFVTLTTLGYGDISPAGETARSFSLVEAVTGQFYIAVIVAEVVGKRVAQAISPPPAE